MNENIVGNTRPFYLFIKYYIKINYSLLSIDEILKVSVGLLIHLIFHKQNIDSLLTRQSGWLGQ